MIGERAVREVGAKHVHVCFQFLLYAVRGADPAFVGTGEDHA